MYMMQVIVAGQIVTYIDEGTGPILLMVHGWGDQKETWRALINELTPDFRCIALDLPNFGASSDNDSVIDLGGYANALAVFLTKLGVVSYTYIGHSMGGQIGIYATGKVILQPDKLILIASAGIRDDKTVRRKALKAGSAVLRRLLPTQAKRKIYQKIGSDYDPLLSPVHKAIINAVLSTDVQQEAARIIVPTVLIYGSADDATPPHYGKRLSDLIDGATYELIDGQDHFLHQKAAGVVAATIRTFVGTAP